MIHTLCDDLLVVVLSFVDGLDAVRLHASSRTLREERAPLTTAAAKTSKRYARLCNAFGARFVRRFRWTGLLAAVASTAWDPHFVSPTGYIDRVRNVRGPPILWGSDPEGRAFVALRTNCGTLTVFQRFGHTKDTWAIGENLLGAFRTSVYWIDQDQLVDPHVPLLIDSLLARYRDPQISLHVHRLCGSNLFLV